MDWELSVEAFSRRFDTEEACARKLYQIKWPEGYVCPLCRHREAAVTRTRRLPLTGHVRVNEDRHGPTSFSSVMRRNVKYQPLLTASSISEEGQLLRVKLHQVPAEHLFVSVTTKYGMQSFLQQSVAPGADLKVAPGIYNSARYRPLNAFCHKASQYMNDTYCGLGPKHLQAYLDEYGYRFNFASSDVSIVRDLLQQCFSRPVITYRQLIRKTA
jgi:hypothetical protein